MRFLRLTGYAVALLVLLLAAGIATLSWWIQTPQGEEYLRQKLVSYLEEATGAEVTLQALTIRPWNLYARLQGFTLRGTEPADQEPLFHAESIEIQGGLRSFGSTAQRIYLRRVSLMRPAIHLIVDSTGRWNFPERASKGTGPTLFERFISLKIAEFVFKDGALQWNEHRIDLDLVGKQFNLLFAYDNELQGYRGRISFDPLIVSNPLLKDEPFRCSVELVMDPEGLSLPQMILEQGNSRLSFSGRLTDYQDPRGDFEFTGLINLEELGEKLQVPLERRGSFVLSGEAWFGGGRKPGARGRISGRQLGYRSSSFEIRNFSLSSNFELDAGGVRFSRASILAFGGLIQGKGAYRNFRHLQVAGSYRHLSAQAIVASSQLPQIGWETSAFGQFSLQLDRLQGQTKNLQLKTSASLEPVANTIPVSGQLDLDYSDSREVPIIIQAHIQTPHSQLQFSGAPQTGLDFQIATTSLEELLSSIPSWLDSYQALPFPVRTGLLKLEGTVTRSWSSPQISGHAVASNLQLAQLPIETASATFVVDPTVLRIRNLRITQQQIQLSGQFGTQLNDWRFQPDLPLDGFIVLRASRVEELASRLDYPVPIAGDLYAEVSLGGSFNEPYASALVSLQSGALFQESFDEFSAKVEMDPGRIQISEAYLRFPSGEARINGIYEPSSQDWQNGRIQIQVALNNLPLNRLRFLRTQTRTIGGIAEASFKLSARLRNRKLLVEQVTGNLAVAGLALNNQVLGDFSLDAATRSGTLLANLRLPIQDGLISGTAQFKLSPPHEFETTLDLHQLPLDVFLRAARQTEAPTSWQSGGLVEGKASLSGTVLDKASWRGQIQLTQLELEPRLAAEQPGAPPGRPAIRLKNEEPVQIEFTGQWLAIPRMHLVSTGTDLTVSGKLEFAGEQPQLAFQVNGKANLHVLQNFYPQLTTGGTATLAVQIHGTLQRPQILGKLEVTGASFYYEDVPTGLENLHASIVFDRYRATIESLKARLSGGNLSARGFVGFGGDELVFRLLTDLTDVRLRYPRGFSNVFDAQLTFTGTARSSLLAGQVLLKRVTITTPVDFASFMSGSGAPIRTPVTTNPLLEGMRFDIHLRSLGDTVFESGITRDVRLQIDARLRGSPPNPVLLGRMAITQGELLFFGNRYRITQGEIAFLNPVRIEPELELTVETRVRAVEVVLTFSGPLNRLNFTYRSDPPLELSEILTLLATGGTVSDQSVLGDPAFLSQQSVLSHTYSQMGGTFLIGQALTAPITGRLQRFFGVSQIRINPQLIGIESEPQARVTIEQRIGTNLTLIYTTNLSQAKQQSVRIEWDITRDWLFIAGREENGVVGVDVFFRKRF